MNVGRSRDGAMFGKSVREHVDDAVKFVYTDELRAYQNLLIGLAD